MTMKCPFCKGHYIEQCEDFRFDDDVCGTLVLKDAAISKCDSCGDVLLLPGTTDRMLDLVEKETNRLLLDTQTVGNFITAKQAAELLGVSITAFAKNRRILRGFIHQIEMDGHKKYHRKSVMEFGSTGDGRFPLAPKAPQKVAINNAASSDVGCLKTERQAKPCEIFAEHPFAIFSADTPPHLFKWDNISKNVTEKAVTDWLLMAIKASRHEDEAKPIEAPIFDRLWSSLCLHPSKAHALTVAKINDLNFSTGDFEIGTDIVEYNTEESQYA